MGDLQGAKAAQKRERNTGKNDSKGSKSQSKVNEAAKSIVCNVCKQSFVSRYTSLPSANYYIDAHLKLVTTRAPALEEHAQNKHNKTIAECFPNYGK
ncbi:hypothetical protein AN958_01118 [Leucoagaricus sp. SymC.cos]|nr:hypothetical protein AN958_01118 [Leucoagaricus sp. SymC.cos]